MSTSTTNDEMNRSEWSRENDTNRNMNGSSNTVPDDRSTYDSCHNSPERMGVSPPPAENSKARELPPCEVERLEEILSSIKTTYPPYRARLMRELVENDGAYIAKLLDLFDLCEDEEDKTVLYRMFNIFYALVEVCDRKIMEILLSDKNFLTVVGVFGHNPGLIREMDFRTELEQDMEFKEIVPIKEKSVVDRVHMNYRIHVIKDNVLSRTLPDCSVIMLDHIVNENNYHILSYLSDSEEYWDTLKQTVKDPSTRQNGLQLLKEIIDLVRITRPLDRLSQQRRGDPMSPPSVFNNMINSIFANGIMFESFAITLGSPDSKMEEVSFVLEILNSLITYQGPDRLRNYLAVEGKCIAPPKNEDERIVWKPGSSLFTALIFAFEKYEPTRMQMFVLLREVFRVPMGHDDKFLSVLYPNYIHWLLQPLKYTPMVDNTGDLFSLQDRIMELLTFCTEMHGYRVKYLFGRQPIASYVKKMLQSKNKLFIIHAVKFIRACAARAEAFFFEISYSK